MFFASLPCFLTYTTCSLSLCLLLPQITLVSDSLQFGDCFLRYSYMREVEFRNDSPLLARYDLVAQVRRMTANEHVVKDMRCDRKKTACDGS